LPPSNTLWRRNSEHSPNGVPMAVKEHKTPAKNLATFVCNRR
jgi:hypothetical protein